MVSEVGSWLKLQYLHYVANIYIYNKNNLLLNWFTVCRQITYSDD